MLCNIAGEILLVHVTTDPADSEECIVQMLRKVISMEKKIEQLSDEDRVCVNNLLQQLQAVVVGARITQSILLITHLLTTQVLSSVCEMYSSSQLSVVVRDLFHCLAKDDDLTVQVEIDAAAFQQCEDGFADDGMSTAALY